MQNKLFSCLNKYKYFIISVFVIASGLWYSNMVEPYTVNFIPKDVKYYNTVEIKEKFDEDLYLESLVNINTAGAEELMRLKGIGEKTAEKILEYRKENGNFTSGEEIMEVKGIGEKKFEEIKDYIVVE